MSPSMTNPETNVYLQSLEQYVHQKWNKKMAVLVFNYGTEQIQVEYTLGN